MANQDIFEKLTEEWSEELQEAFLRAVEDIRERVKIKAIAKLLQDDDIDGALRAVGLDPLDFREIDRVMSGLLSAGGDGFALEVERQAPKRGPEGGVVRFLFDARNPRAENWIRSRSGRLITEITDGQRIMIRKVLEEGLAAGRNPRTIAIELVGRRSRVTGKREGGLIGLTSGQEEWQRSYARELASIDPAMLRRALGKGLRDKRFDATVRRAIKTGEPIPAETRSKMLTAYRNRSLKYRAETIARNEVIQSLGRVQQEAWDQAIERGHVDVDDLIKIPISARDERVRHKHREVEKKNKDGVGWNEFYAVPAGMSPQMHAPYEDEPGCRCRERVKVKRFRGLR